MDEVIEKKYRVLKAKLDVNDEYFATIFGFTNAAAFRNSSARDRYVKGIVAFYENVKEPLD